MRHYGLETGIHVEVNGLCVHSLRATAATNALSHQADIAKVQEWLGHANVSTTRLYNRRKTRPEDSPTFRAPRRCKSGTSGSTSGTTSAAPEADLARFPGASGVAGDGKHSRSRHKRRRLV